MDEAKDGFVLDLLGVTMAWCFADEVTPYTEGVRDGLASIAGDRAHVVVAGGGEHACIVGERRQRLDEHASLSHPSQRSAHHDRR